MSKQEEEWVWVYGDEYGELWEHFGMELRSPEDRMKLKLIELELSEERCS